MQWRILTPPTHATKELEKMAENQNCNNDPIEDALVEMMPFGSALSYVDTFNFGEDIIVFTQGALKGYFAMTTGEDSLLWARSLDEFQTLLTGPRNIDEYGDLVLHYDFIDAFADGKRTEHDKEVATTLLNTLESNVNDLHDEWDHPYACQATWAAKLSIDSVVKAEELAKNLSGFGASSTPQRWAAEAAREYLADLKGWTES